ncbi:MAG: alpha/beta hydrolase [Pseudomonadota bacterium]
MTSARLRLLSALARAFVKPRLRRADDPIEVRQRFEDQARHSHRAPPHTVRRKGDMGGVPVLWVSSGPITSPKILFYVHGGAFILGSPETHFHMVAKVCRLLGCEAVMPRYRLAPVHRFPAGLTDVIAAYEGLIASGRDPGQITVMGDSAGGCLMMGLLAHLNTTNQPMPASAVAISPVLDLTGQSESLRQNAASDAFLVADRLDDLNTFYMGDDPRDDPRASPLWADFPRLPPLLFHVSDDEILRDDSLRMIDKLKALGHAPQLKRWATSFHVFHLMRGYVPEADEALRHIADFIQAQQPTADN